MSSESAKPDTVPGLGFKDKEKAHETIKILEGRDPDYQKLAIKGLIGRAKRTLTLTKDKDKLQNINDAVKIFEDWLSNFELENRSKENRAYLPLSSIEALLPLKKKYQLEDEQSECFLEAYKNAGAEYKNLRTVSSGEDKPTWDIVRNSRLKELLESFHSNKCELWDGELPSKEHLHLILWAYSPEASKIKKNQSKYEELLASKNEEEKEEEEEEEEEKEENGKSERKRKSEGSSSSEDESPKKKNKSN